MKLNYVIIPLLVFLTSFIGSLATSGGMEWYKTIKIPSWTPPGSVIGLVWTIIFILAAFSAIIVWNSGVSGNRFNWIIGIFIANAILNILWSYIFFNQHLIATAFGEAILLDVTVIALIILIWPISKLASLLLVPYASWVAFASYLTFIIWNLNK